VKCKRSPELKKVWGCQGRPRKPEIEIEEGVEYHYLNCPLHFVSPSIWEFIRRLDYYEAFPNAPIPSFENVSPKFLRAYNYYESKKAEIRERQNGR